MGMQSDVMDCRTWPEEHRLTLALIHTSPVLVPSFTALCAEHLPSGTEIFHIVDESLIKNTIKAGKLERLTVRRLGGYVESARLAGADAVLVTCSSVGPAVTQAQQVFDFPVLRIDEAMAEAAVQAGRRIGVLATLRTTLEPTTELVRHTASVRGCDIELQSRLCDGAFEAVLRGDTAEHDRMVREGLAGLLELVDVVVLAQASMARVVAQLPDELHTKPILSSPELAMRRTRDVLMALQA
jgi:Asp/Glu/hydantoin racemase